jgi:hypothetical protein
MITVGVPSSVVEEVIANHARAAAAAKSNLSKVYAERRRLGLSKLAEPEPDIEYRTYLLERFDENLGIDVLPWPGVGHERLVSRAINRIPPFDEKGGGYRDSLVWASVVELAMAGRDVVLISADKAFAGKDGGLAPLLVEEVVQLRGSVVLAPDLRTWLLGSLPWSASTLESAVALGRDQEFYDYASQTDFFWELEPDPDAMGFQRSPFKLSIFDVEWGLSIDRVGSAYAPGGLTIVEYDVDQNVSFEAELPEGSIIEENWTSEGPAYGGRISVSGEIALIARIAVLFGGESGFSVEGLSWRRADGVGPGQPLLESGWGQESLF